VDDTAVQATTFFTGLSTEVPNPTTPGNPISTSANYTVCSSCHQDYDFANTKSHILQNGGSNNVTKDAEGRTILSTNPANVESCSVCHGAGAIADLQVVHHIPATTAAAN
jgi:cytochrome c553